MPGNRHGGFGRRPAETGRPQGRHRAAGRPHPYSQYPEVKPAICRGFADRYSTQALQVIERTFGFVEIDPPGEDAGGTDETKPPHDHISTAKRGSAG